MDGGWSVWGSWSACSETCGNGTQSRTRVCNNPKPENNGADCVGPPLDSKECFVQHCPGKLNPSERYPTTDLHLYKFKLENIKEIKGNIPEDVSL